jgi:hypothetical protein
VNNQRHEDDLRYCAVPALAILIGAKIDVKIHGCEIDVKKAVVAPCFFIKN